MKTVSDIPFVQRQTVGRVTLELVPDLFGWVEFRGVLGEPFGLQAGIVQQNSLDDWPLVDLATVPQEEDRSGHVAKKLSHAQCCRLLEVLLEGAMAYGYPNEIWTLKRIAKVIRQEFGVRHHPNHVWRILRELHWSCQVPERRPVQRDEKAVEHWNRYKWPHIKKGARTWGPSGVPG